MNYLVIKDNSIKQICESVEQLLEYLQVSVTDEGRIEIGKDKIQMSMCYNMEDFTKEEVIKDLAKYRLKHIECLLKIGIFKLERIK
jgi:hypothetical protein